MDSPDSSTPFLNFQNTKEVVLVVLGAFIYAAFNRWFEKKTKVIAYIGQTGTFKLKERENSPEAEISTHQLVIRNEGKKLAKNVNVIHVNLPDDFTVFPAIEWNIKELNYGAKALIFPNLAQSQQITIAYLYPPNFPYTIHGEISHDEGMAKIIKVLPMRQFSWWVYTLCYMLMISGLAFWTYLLFFLFTYLQIL